MKVTVVGCGNAFSNESYNQSFLLEEDGRNLLMDVGYQVPRALKDLGISHEDIDDIYISHLHADHIGGLEYFAFMRYDWMNKPRKYSDRKEPKSLAPKLIGNVQLLDDLWHKTLRGGLGSMEGFVAKLSTFFEPVPIEPNESFEWQGWNVELVQQIHIMSGSVITPSFGMVFSKKGRDTIYFTTDSQHCSPRQIEDFYRKADIIFQDCECVGVNARDKTFAFGSGVHANYAQLAGYPSANSPVLSEEVKAKMWLSHYQDFVLQDKDFFGNGVYWDGLAQEDGFKGFVKVGQKFEF